MIMRALALAMMFTLTLGTANASGVQTMKAVFDEFNYTAQVEGNRELAQKNLAEELKALQTSGVTNQQMINYAVSQVKDRTAANELAQAFALLNANQMSDSEVADTIGSVMKRAESQGASWTGAGSVLGFALVAVLVVFVVVTINSNSGACSDPLYYETHPRCYDPYDPDSY